MKKLWHTLCKTCHGELKKQCDTIQKDHTEQFDIDENHSYMIGRYGPVIKIKIDGKTTFRSVKKGISLENLKNGTLSIEDVIEEKKSISFRCWKL